MANLLYYELSKILNKRTIILSILILLVTSSFVFINSINEYDYFDDGRGKVQAINDTRDIKQELNGILTKKELKECVMIYRNIFNNKKNFDANGNLMLRKNSKEQTDFIKYDDLFDLLTRTYSPLSTHNANILNNIDVNLIEVKDIFENRNQNIKDILHYDINDKVIETNELIYSYSTGWQSLFSDMSQIHIVVLILITILIAPIFSKEYKNHLIPIIYSSRYGKTKVVSAKIIAAFLCTSIIYFLPILLYTFLKLKVFGYDGFDSLIQTTSSYWLSLFNFTFLEAYIFAIFTGYVASISTMFFCIVFSIITKKDALSIILSLLVVLLPLIGSSNLVLQPFFDFFPSNIMNVAKLLLNFQFITVSSYNINKIYFILTTLLILSLMIIFYLKQQRKYRL